jgi:alanine dehydrogenase
MNTHRGSITYPAIAQEFDMRYVDPLQALGNA